MTENNKPYQSIACSLYDNLESFATRKTRCIVVYKIKNAEQTTESIIVDLFARDGAEFLKLENGTIIRLDDLITVNGIPMNKQC